jgi:hypothetical protein
LYLVSLAKTKTLKGFIIKEESIIRIYLLTDHNEYKNIIELLRYAVAMTERKSRYRIINTMDYSDVFSCYSGFIDDIVMCCKLNVDRQSHYGLITNINAYMVHGTKLGANNPYIYINERIWGYCKRDTTSHTVQQVLK